MVFIDISNQLCVRSGWISNSSSCIHWSWFISTCYTWCYIRVWCDIGVLWCILWSNGTRLCRSVCWFYGSINDSKKTFLSYLSIFYLFIHPFFHQSIHLLNNPSIHAIIHSFVHLFIHSSILSILQLVKVFLKFSSQQTNVLYVVNKSFFLQLKEEKLNVLTD